MLTMTGRRPAALTARPWRGLAYLVTAVVPGVTGLAVLAVTVGGGGVLSAFVVGLPLLASTVFIGIPMASFERMRLQIIDREPITDPHRPPEADGLLGWARTRLRESATWRELAYTLLLVIFLWPLDLIVVVLAVGLPVALMTAFMPVLSGGHRELLPGLSIATPAQALMAFPAGVVLLAGAAYAIPALAAAQGGLARMLLAPREEELARRLEEVTISRARLVSAFEAERRRIERDLHDGAQQRLAALSIRLGMARLDVQAGPLADQLAQAQEQVGLALNELRELVRGIHPQILTDRGLSAAVAELADRSPVRTDVDLDIPQRPSASVEATGYFVICEALANVAKHSRARRALVRGRRLASDLVVEIEDDGVGGAHGLTALADRVSVAGGQLTVSSPPGGPTLLRVVLPCG